MDNSFYISSKTTKDIKIERFHICTWEFVNNTCLVEFGCEVVANEEILSLNELDFTLYIPWLNNNCVTEDFYDKLTSTPNSRFIFNDSVDDTSNFDGGKTNNGIKLIFRNKPPLCVLPIEFTQENDELYLKISIPEDKGKIRGSNIYFRFAVTPDTSHISLRKGNLNKSTIIYDIKLNEKRNITALKTYNDIALNSCFCFNILPNNYTIDFYEAASLKNIRTLEFENFNNYMDDDRVKKDELIVVFNKKEEEKSYTFFSMYSKEILGTNQLLIALLLNLLSGFLLFLPSLRGDNVDHNIYNLPLEVYVVIVIWILAIIYFIFNHRINSFFKKAFNK